MPRPIPLLRLLLTGLATLLVACSASCTQSPSPQASDAPRTSAESSAEAPEDPGAGGAPEAPAPGGEGGGEDADALQPAEIATVGWDGLTDAPIVLLRTLGSGKVVPIWVGIAEARAIAAALHGVEYPRPMTHDLMRNLVSELGGVLEELQIHDIRDGTYFGRLRLRVDGRTEPLLVDTRPSDGMALALRTGAAIQLSQRVLDQTPDFEFLAPEAGQQVVRSLGLTVVAPDETMRREFGLPDRSGLVVTQAVGEAASQGLRRGDLIVEINGVVPEAPVDFLDALRAAPPAAPVSLTYWRDGEEHAVELFPELLGEPEEGPRQIA